MLENEITDLLFDHRLIQYPTMVTMVDIVSGAQSPHCQASEWEYLPRAKKNRLSIFALFKMASAMITFAAESQPLVGGDTVCRKMF